MAIFELDDGHGTLVQPMRPSAESFEDDTAALIGEHAAALIGESVLPVREGGSGGPRLLALDASAQPVVVEVVQLLDAQALVRALQHAGAASRMSRSDMARAYRGGRDAFEPDLAVFRDRAPLVHTERRDGVRLVLMCAEVADGVRDAVEFIASGVRVQVMRLGVTEGPGGRRYLDVSPMHAAAPAEGRRPVEPASITGAVPQVTASTPAEKTEPAPAPKGAAAAEPKQPAAAPAPKDAPAPAPAEKRAAPPAPAPKPAADSASGGRRQAREAERDAVGQADAEKPAATTRTSGSDDTTQIPPVPAEKPSPTDIDAVPHPLPELAALAAAERKPVELVWLRVRRNQRLVATLRPDGLLELADGALHADPTEAATVAADLERPTDGWRVWRVGDDGPSLGEAVGVR